ncbi:NAD-dependent epimerase/dehydratase family protein [Maribacter hydrothermalis]|uniref:NAD-dependent epimerase/dehydratase domain-containing protein n=1 Tax=Maribacter hydrothermalis TaxID=1836467 RepID=A0A1B7ZD72_9FLAO|nr:NAD-dependent epimerase/dehydratase family protein [Maribacter hydrothermalis]APQ18497.1 hypothetical protein BTR34_14750 [Maribacter hydrothermalis]OBR41296.1 hypothetical protein A9200_13345 [Maribacter hydrothermalis]
MNILLSGASGFLGSIIQKYFEELGHKVDSIGRSKENTIVANLADFNSSINTYYDLVIHAAGKAHMVPKNRDEEKMFFDVNLEGTKNLIKSLVKPPKNFVFISTVAVYGLDYGIDIKEDNPLNANTPYGISKKMAEEVVLKWSSENKVSTTILRLPLVIGHNPKGNLINMINGIKKGFYFNIGKGDAKKSMVLAEDIAIAIQTLLNHPGTYHLTDGYDPSFKELSKVIADHYKIKRVPSLSYFIIKPVALIGDLMGKISPINSNKLNKITQSLTFNDSKVKLTGWKPRQVLINKELWLN